jgi:hypothetical protein
MYVHVVSAMRATSSFGAPITSSAFGVFLPAFFGGFVDVVDGDCESAGSSCDSDIAAAAAGLSTLVVVAAAAARVGS